LSPLRGIFLERIRACGRYAVVVFYWHTWVWTKLCSNFYSCVGSFILT
jgi:hypothetical protein